MGHSLHSWDPELYDIVKFPRSVNRTNLLICKLRPFNCFGDLTTLDLTVNNNNPDR